MWLVTGVLDGSMCITKQDKLFKSQENKMQCVDLERAVFCWCVAGVSFKFLLLLSHLSPRGPG